jgi:DNA polymerase III subunit epsilon
MLDRLSLRLRILLFFALLALGAGVAIGFGLWAALARAPAGADPTAVAIQGGLIAGLLSVGLVTGVWYLFDANVGRAIERLSAAIRARAHAGIERDLDRERREARYLGDLAPAVEAISKALVETRSALAESVARETGRLAAEKSRLETLLADVPVAVLLCSADHQLAFYNGQAVEILGGGAAPGLDRNLLDYLRDGPIRHAYDRLAGAGDPDAASDLMCTTRAGGRLLAGRMRVLRRREGGGAPGYVLTLRDVTADIAALTRREALLAEVFDRVRRPAANLQTVIGVMAEMGGDVTAGDLSTALLDEVQTLTRAITELGARYDMLHSDWRPLVMTRSGDLADALAGRLQPTGLTLSVEGPELILHVDGFEIVALLGRLAERIAAEGLGRAFSLELVEEDGPGAMIRLAWSGGPLAVGKLDSWLPDVLGPATGDLTARAVLQTHGTEVWPEVLGPGQQALCLPIRQARRAGRRPAPLKRQVVYDFDLLSKARAAAVADTRLEDLTIVVFDTETTGLSPASDEIVQIAAVRIVNGKRVEGEVFDTLVDPGRSIPPGSTEVHGITDQMVRGAPTVAEAAHAFHAFARGAVLVAHNAPFDLEFLRRTEAATGLAFDHPVLDTVLMSAVVYGQLDQHTLDALCARLGIVIPESARHTALGDTVATAEAFLRLVPMLRAKGFATFGQVLAEMRRHGRLLKDANAA